MPEHIPATERRKNPARKKAAPTVEYQVRWTPEESRWDVFRNNEKTGAFSQREISAVENAILMATRDVAAGLGVAVFAVRDGKTESVWHSP